MNDFTHFVRISATTHTLCTVAQCLFCGCKIRNTDYEEAGMIEGVSDEALLAIGLEDAADVALPHGSICIYCNEAECQRDMMPEEMDATERRYWVSLDGMDEERDSMMDMDDDREALASAGHGTDEDYGGDREDFG